MRADPGQPEMDERAVPPVGRATSTKNLPTRAVPVVDPVDAPKPSPEVPAPTEPISLLPEEMASRLRSRWEMIQSGFVDEPKQTVDQAGELVREALGQLTDAFEDKRQHLHENGAVPTEDLRQTLRHYRLLLNRLL